MESRFHVLQTALHPPTGHTMAEEAKNTAKINVFKNPHKAVRVSVCPKAGVEPGSLLLLWHLPGTELQKPPSP